MARKDINFFKFRVNGTTYTVPTTTTEGSDSFSLTSSWSTVNLQGGTEAISAFNYVNNPTIPINLKFNEDLWREPECINQLNVSYEKLISIMASLQYPIESSGKILPPYCTIEYNGNIFRGYFTNVRLTQSGPFRQNGSSKPYRTVCDFTGQFTVVKSSAPTRSGVANSIKTYYQ